MLLWIILCVTIFLIVLHLLDEKYEWITVIPNEIMKRLGDEEK